MEFVNDDLTLVLLDRVNDAVIDEILEWLGVSSIHVKHEFVLPDWLSFPAGNQSLSFNVMNPHFLTFVVEDVNSTTWVVFELWSVVLLSSVPVPPVDVFSLFLTVENVIVSEQIFVSEEL